LSQFVAGLSLTGIIVMHFLLERLAAPHRQGSPSFAQNDLLPAIAAQIQRIVSARVVQAADGQMTLLEFGMPNVVELTMNSKTQLERYAARLQRLITHYEPRLVQPRVTVENGTDAMMPYRLQVTGMLGAAGDAHTFHFDLPLH
jgi:type VI secretion system lysozyme-like protein